MADTLKLEPGHFYKTAEGQLWCCFRYEPEHVGSEATCVRVADEWCRMFTPDGKMSDSFADGRQSDTPYLVVECDKTGEPIVKLSLRIAPF